MNVIYLDYAATTPLDSRVLDIMVPLYREKFGNPSSVHLYGQRAESELARARRSMAEDLNCAPEEVIFTSCGTESDNLALRGAALAARQDRGADQVLIPSVEHHAVLHTAEQLESLHGFEVIHLPVDEYGQTHPEDVANQLSPRTALVSVMYANNEIGSYNPIPEIGSICREAGVPFHTDAVQAGAHRPLDVRALGVDLLSLGAHKFYGPKGIGALYVRTGTRLVPVQTGGSQEFGLRAATENIALISGMAAAFRLVQEEGHHRRTHTRKLRDSLIKAVLEMIPDVRLTGHPDHRLPNHASFAFRDVDANLLVSMLDARGFAVSSGSACKTGRPEPSRILSALGFSSAWTRGSLRVTVGVDTTLPEIERFSNLLPGLIAEVRELS